MKKEMRRCKGGNKKTKEKEEEGRNRKKNYWSKL